MALPINRERLQALEEEDIFNAALTMALEGVRPHLIARKLNISRAQVERIVTQDNFVEAIRAQNPEAAETWQILTATEKVSSLKVEAQNHAEAALNTLVSLMIDSKQDNVRLRAAEDVLQITGAMSKTASPVELVELTPASEKALSEAMLAVFKRPPKLLDVLNPTKEEQE